MIRLAVVAAALLAAALLFTLALPVGQWRTGDRGLASMASVPEARTPPFPRRVWIDTDAACGHSRRTDPDDCFALALLLRSPEVEVVGVSTVAGNAPREVVDATVRALLARAGVRVSPSLGSELKKGPLTILALGPLTNIAAVLDERPDLRKNASRLIAVMGRRPGHLFHPSEGAGGGALFGHGPVFRDFNFALDPQAAARILEAKIPLSLVPYDAARGVELTAADLDRLEASLPWLVPRARGWLEYWRSDIGRAGFYPFDLLAAAYVLEPASFRCTPVRARVGRDDALFWAPQALLVEPAGGGDALYCGRAHSRLKPSLIERLSRGDRTL